MPPLTWRLKTISHTIEWTIVQPDEWHIYMISDKNTFLKAPRTKNFVYLYVVCARLYKKTSARNDSRISLIITVMSQKNVYSKEVRQLNRD